MNYNDQILENKTFNFFKQLMYNIALSICIMLVGVLIAVYGFKFKLYKVESASEAPYLNIGDIVVVKAQDEYHVGELIKFNENGLPTTHRLVGKITEGGVTYYICHGDNVNNLDKTEKTESDWEDDVAYIKNFLDQNYTLSQIKSECGNAIQTPTKKQVEGKVVATMRNYGTYVEFIKGHSMLFISLVAGIWCISSVVQNEIEMKKSRRLV